MKNVTRSIDVSSLAQEVMASCSILDQGALSEVEQLLLYMQARKRTKEGDAGLVLSVVYDLFERCILVILYFVFIYFRDGCIRNSNKETSEANGRLRGQYYYIESAVSNKIPLHSISTIFHVLLSSHPPSFPSPFYFSFSPHLLSHSIILYTAGIRRG